VLAWVIHDRDGADGYSIVVSCGWRAVERDGFQLLVFILGRARHPGHYFSVWVVRYRSGRSGILAAGEDVLAGLDRAAVSSRYYLKL